MDILRLGPAGSTNYKPDMLIENYSSMIWTERFQSPGEFELKTPLIQQTLDLLPAKTMISHRDTREVMIVETHSISVDEEGYHILTVKGKSADDFLNHRHVEAKYGKKRDMRKEYPPAGAALVLIWQAIDNNSGKDVTRGDPDEDFSWNTKDALPNVAVTDSVTNAGPTKRWWLREGPLYPQLMSILERDDLGLRTIRPDTSSAQKVSVKWGLENRGDIERILAQDITQLRFDVYRGVDRSDSSSGVPKVRFKVLHGDIENAEYLFSIDKLKTACEVMSGVGGADVYRAGDSGLTGWDRRVMSFDAGEPEFPNKPTDPGKNATQAQNNKYEEDLAVWQGKVDDKTAKFLADTESDATRALRRQRKVSIFSGDISPLAPYKYKTHYDLGDIVSLYGDYNQTARVMISEYVRTEDAEGDRGYPGLILP